MKKIYLKKIKVLSLVLGCCTHVVYAQSTDSTDAAISLENLKNLSAQTEASVLQQQLNENVAASSKKALSLRETPGIVSVISSEEIKHSGARDLVDLLRQVPGLDFGADIYLVQGISMRGNWGIEGKVLVLVDGIEYNETLYQGVPFGDKFPLNQISRIEIIRGPGSSIYGGTAEYGVINIITKGAAGEEEVSASGSMGILQGGYGRRNISASVGKKLGDQVFTDFSFFSGKSVSTDQPYQDFTTVGQPSQYDVTKSTEQEATYVNAGIKYKNARLRAMYDRFDIGHPFYKVGFSNLFISLKDDIRLNQKLTLTPFLFYTIQNPWEAHGLGDTDNTYDYKIITQRSKANLTAAYDISRKINLIAGAEYFYDFASNKAGEDYFGENKNEVSYQTGSLFAQGLLKHRLANITLGFRYDKHNAFGSAFVPRFAITKRFDNFHFKALYSHAYRAPGIENINYDAGIKPEHSQVAELELGYQFTPDMILAVNLYNIKTRDIIIYTSSLLDNGNYLENYQNYDRSGTRGLEAIYKIQQPKWQANLSYSFYQALAGHTVDVYRVAPKPGLFVAFPAHKVTANGNLQLGSHLRISPSLIYSSERYGYTSLDEEENAVLERFAPYLLANLHVGYDNLGIKGLDAGIGIYDIFNTKQPLLRAYQSEIDYLPGRSRELVVKFSYRFSFQAR
ncbi:TonB-dependent receptor plug domain-containing protein [Rhodocytophaga rosea]|uniref:TonB-dependent receptor plug domain-containing protein n=1 Tax=Rhodocytophaga rosea TaxID=2704465 RepID=A0A6C0GSB5_9BACT|nr:TonB-dependent receptor [Rhodocytophaga rosea]QHT70995.1 TonB-dependent receptor plug domain-containing protein [Rhodocytophaga rosea]